MNTFVGSCSRSAAVPSGVRTRWRAAPLLFVGMLMLACVVPARGQSRELQDLSAQLAKKITTSGKKSVAVVDFTDLQGNVTELGRFLAEELSVSLSQQANGFTVIDRTYLKAILREHKLAATGLIDPATASKLGEIAGVQALVTGSITPLGDNVSLSVKVLDASTEAIIAATIAQIPRTEAINRLLKTGISAAGGTSSAPEPGGTPSAGESGGQSTEAAVSAHEHGFDMVVNKCVRAQGGLECVGEVTDKSGRPITLQLEGGYLLDNLGNQYTTQCGTRMAYEKGRCGVRMTLGSSGTRQDLQPDLPMSFTVISNGLSNTATSISLVLTCAYWGQPMSFILRPRQVTVALRHIPIQGG